MKTKVREKANWPVTILLILGLITVVFPLYMTIVIAFKQPTEMTNSVAGILSLPEKFSLANFREAMEVTDFWHSLGNSVLITVITVVLAIVIHSLLGYAIARNKRSKFYKFIYLYVVSGMFVPFAILMMPLVKQTAEMGLDNKVGVIILYTVFYMPMNVLLYSGYLTNIPMALEEAACVDGASCLYFNETVFRLRCFFQSLCYHVGVGNTCGAGSNCQQFSSGSFGTSCICQSFINIFFLLIGLVDDLHKFIYRTCVA